MALGMSISCAGALALFAFALVLGPSLAWIWGGLVWMMLARAGIFGGPVLLGRVP